MKSQFKCPACQQPLTVHQYPDLDFPVLYCVEGKCKSQAAEIGQTVTTTELAAHEALVKAVEAEIEAKPDCCG